MTARATHAPSPTTAPEGPTTAAAGVPRDHHPHVVALEGAVAGAAVGAIAGPAGIAAGGAIGGLVGMLLESVVASEQRRHDGHDSELDEEIGVIGGTLGGVPTEPAHAPDAVLSRAIDFWGPAGSGGVDADPDQPEK